MPVEYMLPDKDARERALDVTKSFIVEAPAGSGKTKILVERFIKLLKTCNKPEKCLAITFTKKAALEMRDRVLQSLSYSINSEQLNILTIDAFCMSLVAKMPLMSKIGINLSIAQDINQLYSKAIEQLFKDPTPDLVNLLYYLDNDQGVIKNLLIDMLAKREQWLALVMQLQDFSLQNSNLKHAITDLLQNIKLYIPSEYYQKKIIDIIKLSRWPEANIADLSLWADLVKLLLTKSGQLRKAINTKLEFTTKNPLSQEFLTKLKQINLIPDIDNAINNIENQKCLTSLFKLLPELVAHLMVVFQEEQQVDFIEIALMALRGLDDIENSSDLALVLDTTIDHILVDEFQDTSLLQFKLLQKLTSNWSDNDNRTLFLVGDPMQSIYRFRQANVGLFLHIQQNGFNNIKLNNLYLSANFRSSNNIIKNLNNLFVKVFPEKPNLALGGVVYSNSVANNNVKDSEFKFFKTNNEQQEALNIIALVNNIKKNNNKQSIAILVRSRNHAKNIIKYLKLNNIKFQANEIESMADNPIIADLIVLTRIILHPNDLLSWLAFLRGPLVGLLLADLHALFEITEKIPVLTILQDYKNNNLLSDNAKLRLNKILPLLFDAINKLEDYNNIAILIEDVWFKLGGNLLAPKAREYSEKFLFEILANHNFSYDPLFRDINLNNKFLEVNPSDLDLSQVQIMTIHKAKGLEFDTVIVPGLNKKISLTKPQLLLWDSNYLLFGLIKSDVYNFINHFEKQRELYEEQRLLYVAISRAKYNFYGFTNNIINKHHSFFKLLEPLVEFVNHDFGVELQKTEELNNKKDLILSRFII